VSSPSTAPSNIPKSVTRSECDRLCLKYGPFVQVAGLQDPWGNKLSGSQLLLAIAGRESSFGRNITPRHEPAYDVDGRYWHDNRDLRAAVALYGPLAASSFGLLQIMACNARGFTPRQLAESVEDAMRASVDRLNYYVIGHQKAATLEQICDAWNTGNYKDKNVPEEYIAEVKKHYASEVMMWADDATQ
jgi:hypothetical protein